MCYFVPRFLGLFHLFRSLLRYCYDPDDPDDPNQDLRTHTCIPKLNSSSDIAEYFVRKVYPVHSLEITSAKHSTFKGNFGSKMGDHPLSSESLIDRLCYDDKRQSL